MRQRVAVEQRVLDGAKSGDGGRGSCRGQEGGGRGGRGPENNKEKEEDKADDAQTHEDVGQDIHD